MSRMELGQAQQWKLVPGDHITAVAGGMDLSMDVERIQSEQKKTVFFVVHEFQTVSWIKPGTLSCIAGPLKMKGVPGSLCELVCNMTDAINGNFRGNDTYDKISDVTKDLELMLDKPSMYLFVIWM
jgi:hypothetical protein